MQARTLLRLRGRWVFATAVIHQRLMNYREAVPRPSRGMTSYRCCRLYRQRRHLGFVGATCDRAVEPGTARRSSTRRRRLDRAHTYQRPRFRQREHRARSLSSFAQHVRAILPTRQDGRHSRAFRNASPVCRPAAYRSGAVQHPAEACRSFLKMHHSNHRRGVRQLRADRNSKFMR